MSDLLRQLGVEHSFECECGACGGTGACPDCDGKGRTRTKAVPDDHPALGELAALAQDKKRLMRQTVRLCKLKPEFSENYKAQLSAALETVKARAVSLLKGETP